MKIQEDNNMTNLETAAKNYAINRRNENYDIESDLCELTNGFPENYVQEIENSVENSRTESFIAGCKFILSKNENEIKDLQKELKLLESNTLNKKVSLNTINQIVKKFHNFP